MSFKRLGFSAVCFVAAGLRTYWPPDQPADSKSHPLFGLASFQGESGSTPKTGTSLRRLRLFFPIESSLSGLTSDSQLAGTPFPTVSTL